MSNEQNLPSTSMSPPKSVELEKVTLQNLEKIPGRGLYTEQARQQRVLFVEKQLNKRFNNIAPSQLKAEKLRGVIWRFPLNKKRHFFTFYLAQLLTI